MLVPTRFRPALFCLFSASLWGQVPPDALTRLNEAFRSTYAHARSRHLAGPILLVEQDQLLLLRDGIVTAQATIRPALYHRLKALDHVPLALQLTLAPLAPGPLSQETRMSLAALRTLAEVARKELPQTFPAGPMLSRQQRILTACIQLLEAFLLGEGGPARLATFAKHQTPLLMANAQAAADLQLEALHRAVTLWRKDLKAGEWDELRVLITGSHMAREGEVSWQYFSRLLRQPTEGQRIVFAEGLWDRKAALTLLATHDVDRSIAEAFFQDPGRLHRDVLADAATSWLDTRSLEGPQPAPSGSPSLSFSD